MEITYNEKKIAIQKVRFGTNRTGSRTQSKYIEEKWNAQLNQCASGMNEMPIERMHCILFNSSYHFV